MTDGDQGDRDELVEGDNATDAIPASSGGTSRGLEEQLPAEVLVDALTENRAITDFDASSVPSWLMAEPIEVGLAVLEDHGKRCSNPRQCSDTPGPLRPLLKMRRAARNQHREQVHSALWRFPSSTMVDAVRASVAKQHDELVGEIESGKFFVPERLRPELHAVGTEDAQRLAAALWSTGFADPRVSDLFKILPALVPPLLETVASGMPNQTAVAVSQPREKPRHREKRLALEREIDGLKKELAGARDDRRERAIQLADATRQLEGALDELAASRDRIGQLEEALEASTETASSSEARLREAERLRQQSSAASDAYRRDLERAQAELLDAEEARATFVRRLAAAQSRNQELEAQLRAVARDKDAIAEWLAREERRLGDLEYTLEGGARARVVEEKRLRRKLEQAFLDAYPEFKQDRPPSVGAVRSLRFRALGGGNEVGRSAYLIGIGAHDVLVDCGIAVGTGRDEDEKTPDLSRLPGLDALLVTHAHTDHIGWIPALVSSRDYFPIYCTSATAELLPVMLRDSRAHYERFLAEERLKSEYNPSTTGVVEAYTRDDIVETETRLLEARVGDPQGVGATDLAATFFPAGHILGAASILLEGGGRRVVVSGDISGSPQRTVGAFSIPYELNDIDLLVLESTYGDRPRPPARQAEDMLVAFVADTVKRGIALLPCFALGRAQEVLAILHHARRTERLPANLRIFVDGMINKINPIYAGHGKLETDEFVEVGSQIDRDMAYQSAVGPEATPTAVVTTSGMLTGGPVVEWARRLLPDPRHRMALLGYQDEGAPGGILRKLAKNRPAYTITLRDEEGQPVDVRVSAPVAQIPLSAHADQDELVAYARALRPRQIILVHGDRIPRAALRERLLQEEVCADVRLDQDLELR